jgi:hypothetical protein
MLREISLQEDPPVAALADVNQYLALYKEKHAKELTLNRHEKAQEVATMMNNFADRARTALFRRRYRDVIGNLRDKLDTTEKDIAILSGNTSDRVKHFDAYTAERWAHMKARHALELAKHFAKRPDPVPAELNRRTPELLEMCRRERRLFFQSRFDEAFAIRRDCDIRNEEEARQVSCEAMERWELVGRGIREKHRIAEQAMMDWINARKEEIDEDGRVQEHAMRKRAALLSSEICDTRGSLLRKAAPTVLRSLVFDRTKPRGTLIPSGPNIDIEKLAAGLPPRAHEILKSLRNC